MHIVWLGELACERVSLRAVGRRHGPSARWSIASGKACRWSAFAARAGATARASSCGGRRIQREPIDR